MTKILKKPMIWLAILFAGAAVARGLALGQPYLANFSSYQLDSASIARFFLREHFSDMLQPKMDFLVNGSPGILLHYYPVASLVAAIGALLCGGSMEIWGRLQAMMFSLSTIGLIYSLGRKMRGEGFGLVAAAVYAFSPISVIYGQGFMNEAAGVFFVVAAWHTFFCARKSGSRIAAFCGTLLAGLALVTRVNGFYLFAPLLILWAYHDGVWQGRRVAEWFVLCLCSGLLPLLWYGYTYAQALHNPHVFNCMFPQLGRQAPGTALEADFAMALGKSLFALDFTPIGFFLLLTGVATVKGLGPAWPWVLGWFAAVLGSFFMIPQKITDHPFYTMHAVPPAAFLIARGFEVLRDKIGKRAVVLAAMAFLALSVRIFYHPVTKTVLEENKGVLSAAQTVRRLTPPDAKIIAARGAGNCLLCYSDRRGWAFMVEPMKEVAYQDLFRWRFFPPEEIQRRSAAYLDPVQWLEFLRAEGASYFAVAGPEEWSGNPAFRDYLQSHYKKISGSQDAGLIFDLRNYPD